MSFYLEEIIKYFERIPQDRIPVIVKVLLQKHKFLNDATDLQTLRLSAKDKVIYVIDGLLMKISDKEIRNVVLKNFLSTCSIEELPSISELMHLYELRYKRIENDQTYFYEIAISEKDLDVLENLLMQRINAIKENEQIFCVPSLGIIIIMWEKIDIESCKSYFSDKLRNPQLFLKYICKTNGKRYGGDGSFSWIISYSLLRKYIGPDFDIKSVIKQYDKKALFEEFSSQELEIIATCYLDKDETKAIYNDVSTTDINELIDSWRICDNKEGKSI